MIWLPTCVGVNECMVMVLEGASGACVLESLRRAQPATILCVVRRALRLVERIVRNAHDVRIPNIALHILRVLLDNFSATCAHFLAYTQGTLQAMPVGRRPQINSMRNGCGWDARILYVRPVELLPETQGCLPEEVEGLEFLVLQTLHMQGVTECTVMQLGAWSARAVQWEYIHPRPRTSYRPGVRALDDWPGGDDDGIAFSTPPFTRSCILHPSAHPSSGELPLGSFVLGFLC